MRKNTAKKEVVQPISNSLNRHTVDKETAEALTAAISGIFSQDSFSNPLARTGFGTSNLLEATQYPLTRLSYNYILFQSLYRSNWIARKLIDCIAEDMLKNWLQLSSEITPKTIDQFDKCVDDTQTEAKILTAIKWARLFGGSAAIIMLKGEGKRLGEPLDLDDVGPDTYRGLLVLDRWSGISPGAKLITDLDNPDYGLPETYRVTTQTGPTFEVHSSRLLRFTGRSLPQWEFQAEQYWGISEFEVVYEELKKRDNTSFNIASLIFRANIFAIREPDLAQILSGLGKNQNNMQQFWRTLQAQNHLMSSQGMFVLGKDGEMTTHQYSFAGINDVYVSFMLDICGACEIPMSRLFGRTVTGLSATNEGDEHSYYDLISQKQKRELNPQLKKLFPIIAMSLWGKVPKDFDWQFNPVRTLSSEEQAELVSKRTTSIVEPFNAGIIGRQTALKEMKQMSEEVMQWSNITDEMIDEADDTPLGGEQLGEQPGEGVGLASRPGREERGDKAGEAEKRGKKTEDAAIVRRLDYQGLTVCIETDAGQVRAGDGWAVTLTYPYGFILGAAGVDGDALDCFLGPDPLSPSVYVMHVNKPGEPLYDEDKVMLGFRSADEAIGALKENYTFPVEFSMTMLSMKQFRNKLVVPRKITADRNVDKLGISWPGNECPYCGHVNVKDTAYCEQCGAGRPVQKFAGQRDDRPILSPTIGKDGLFVQPDTRSWDDKKKAEYELKESHNRERFAKKFDYADPLVGDAKTYDPEGRYNCGRCNQHEGMECELIGAELTLDLEAGSCRGYEIQDTGDPELNFGRKGVATAEEMMYGVAVNGVGFGCKRCPYHSPAYEKDSQGRDKFCGKGLFRVFTNACCALNGAEVKGEYRGNKLVQIDA